MSTKETLRKLYYRYSPTSWLILLTSFIESTLIIIIQLVVLIGANIKDPLINGVPVYLIIFIGSRLFQFGLIIDGIKNKNTIQLIAINIFNFLSFIYSIVEINQITKVLNDSKDVEYPGFILPLLYISSSILVLAQCFYVWLAYKLYLSFGWDIYKIIGANPRLRKMLLNYHIFLLLLKLDIFFFFGFSLQFLMMILKTYDPEFWLTILALPLTLIILLLAIYGVRNENRSFMFAFIAGLLVAMIYFIFKIVKIYQPSNYEKYKYSKIILTLFASISLFVLGLTAIQSYICYRNFGNGLRDHIKNSSNMKYLIKPTERTLNLDED